MFQYGRMEGFPSMFGENKTPVTVDLDEVVILFIFILVAVTFLIIILGYGKTKSFCIFLQVELSILIGLLLMISNYGQQWEVGYVHSKTPYKAGEKTEIDAEIRVKIGLRSVNITLKAGNVENTSLQGEIIDYNERFSWTWDQGRFGFGPNAGQLQKSLREAQRRGLPIPIIWIVDYFIIEGEGIRFGRFYRTAGWYCHILLWAALFAWILANISLQSVGRYAAYFTGLIGILELSSCIVWISVRNFISLQIPIERNTIELSLGSTFWLTCCGGFLCLFLATILTIMDLRYPNTLSAFLGINILDQYDECVIRAIEFDYIRDKKKKSNKDDSLELGKMSGQILHKKDSGLVLLKRRSTAKRAQKDLFRVNYFPVKIPQYDDVYYNQATRSGTSREERNLIPVPRIPCRKLTC